MSSSAIKKLSEFATRSTKVPAICAHCKHISSVPPSWIKVLDALAPGTGKAELQLTVGAIANRAKLKRPLTEYIVKAAVADRVLELVPGISGTRVYRRTWYGRQILGRWKTAGWTAGRGQ